MMELINGKYTESVAITGTSNKTIKVMNNVAVDGYGISDTWIDTEDFARVGITIVRNGTGEISSNIVWSPDKKSEIFEYVDAGDVVSICGSKPVVAKYLKLSFEATCKISAWVRLSAN